jgi:hypothetical protein
MSYFSQTEDNPTNKKQIPSTAHGLGESDDIVFNMPNKISFNVRGSNVFFTKGIEKKQDNKELTKEEEEKFYKKVFKTSLI